MSWWVLIVSLTQPENTWKESLNERCSVSWALSVSMAKLIDVGRPNPLSAAPLPAL